MSVYRRDLDTLADALGDHRHVERVERDTEESLRVHVVEDFIRPPVLEEITRHECGIMGAKPGVVFVRRRSPTETDADRRLD